MNGVVLLVVLFTVFAVILAFIAFLAYRRVLRRAKGIERGLKMVPMLIHLPPPSADVENTGTRSETDIIRTRINEAQVLYDLIAGTAQQGFKSTFYGQRHIAFEIIANNGLVHYFAAVPIALVSVIEQAIVTAYPGARIEEVEDHNIFNPQGKLTGTVGGELVLRHDTVYPIATIDQMEKDPMSALINALYKLQMGDGAAVQIMIRPARDGWRKRAEKLVAKKRNTRQGGLGFGVADVAKGAVKTPDEWREQAARFEPSKLEEQMLQAIEEKTKHPAFEVLIRVLASSPNYDRSKMIMRNVVNSFSLFEAPGSNGFQFVEGRDMQGLVTAFIFRFFPPELASNVLNSMEMASLFHLPDAQFTPTTQVERQQSKQVDGPSALPKSGLLFGYNFYRGIKKEIHLSPEDRRRHTYIIGQTGTGKSTLIENLVVQDMLAGNGFAFIDPHGDTAEKLISMIPKERAEDVIYFNPGDMEHPLGVNVFEYDTPDQKDFLIQETINMLYKLYDPGKTGIIGPRFEHWYRNAALTLMADPNGASFIEIPKVFTDNNYLKNKFKYLKDPAVIDFWTKEMGQTSDYHKSEMLGWFVSKFGAFQTNDMMRNIIGQTESSFNIREVMDEGKILIVNLSKGRVGELNAQLLGMLFVIKFQAAAMSRANMLEAERRDFSLYVDEFQNFSTDSFASILSEARKYRLNLVVANQFIGQLTDEIRDAVFGNIGTMMCYRVGPEDAEFLVKQFEPIFDQRDLVNLPNFNAVMKLLVGGLPSQPFSITALPPLGHEHPELALAIKQLSAAKFGTPRAQVEADIFARLQSQPKTVTQQPTPAVSKPPATAPTTPPVKPAPTPAPTPVAAPKPAPANPLESRPPAPTPPPAPAAPPVPMPPLEVKPQPKADVTSLGINQLSKPDTAPKEDKKEPLQIEAHETDGRKELAEPPKLIEAHETDGRTEGKPSESRISKHEHPAVRTANPAPTHPKKHPEPPVSPPKAKTMVATHKTAPKPVSKPSQAPRPSDSYISAAKPKIAVGAAAPASKREEASPIVMPDLDAKAQEPVSSPAPKPQPAPDTVKPGPKPAPAAPKLAPGEVFVDKDGNVIQG